MKDLIERHLAERRIDEALSRVFTKTSDSIGKQILDRIPSAQPEQQWIPCSERLPDEDFWSGRERQFSNHVLVTIVNHANDDEQFTDIAQTVDGIWQLSHDVDGDCILPYWCKVIAWMPLPKQYKGEES